MKKQTIEESKTYIKPWMLIASVLIVAVLVGAVIYSGQQSIINDKEEDIKKSKSRVTELSSKLSQMEEYIRSTMTQKQEEATTTQDIVYKDNKYGFSLELPKAWEKYTTKERKLSFSGIESSDSVDFYFDDENIVFNIAMISLENWETVSKLSYYKATKIAEDDKYVFAYSISKGADEDFVTSKQEDINIILNSFNVLNLDTSKKADTLLETDSSSASESEELEKPKSL